MAITLEALILAKKRIQLLFGRPVRPPLPQLVSIDPWTTVPGHQAQMFGVANLYGLAPAWSETQPNAARMDVFLREKPPQLFQQLLQSTFPDIPFRFLVTGKFHFASLEMGLRVVAVTNGTLSLFLNGNGQTFALSCRHVLRGAPASNVFSRGARIGVMSPHFVELDFGSLRYNPLNPGNPLEPNKVDCALAALDLPNTFVNQIPGSAAITDPPAKAGFGAAVQVVHQNTGVPTTIPGTVSSLIADVGIWNFGQIVPAYFDDLITITPSPGAPTVKAGDSGSLVVLSATPSQAVGIVIAKSDSAKTTDVPPRELGPVVVACDLDRILKELHAKAGFPFTIA